MKKALLFIGVLVASFAQAQELYVNNSNGTYQKISVQEVSKIVFNEQEQTVRFNMENGISSQFATSNVTNIAPASNNGTELIYNLDPTVEFDSSDENSYNEVTEDRNDGSGDFIEDFERLQNITITFSEDKVTTTTLPNGVTATINGGHIVINSNIEGASYRVKGTCPNGSLKIYSTKKFQIALLTLILTNPTGPAINIQSSKTVFFTLLTNSKNTLCDGTTYSTPVVGTDGKEEDQKGTIFSEGQLIFNGNGTLNITSLGGHAICSDDYIRVREGNINILSAAKDGFRTKDKFIISRTNSYSPNITINATSNGIECTEGTVTIDAGKLNITSGGEAIKVEYEKEEPDTAVIPDAYINGGYIKIVTTGEKSSAIQTTGNYTQSGGIIQATVNGNGSKVINCDGATKISGGKITAIVKGTVTSDNTSAGGIKSAKDFEMSGGKIAIDCKGKGAKGINSPEKVTINNGELTLLATAENYTEGDDDKKSRAISTDRFTINNGTVLLKAYDYAISAEIFININGGILNAVSTGCIAFEIGETQTGGWMLTKD